MIIYNFIYCFVYKFWEKRGSDGRINGTAIVFFALLMHILLIFEIILDLTGYKISLFPHIDGATYSQRKGFYFVSIPFMIVIWLFYNRNRTDRLLVKYQEEYGDNESRITLRILLFVVIPPILALGLSVMRHKGYF